MTPTRIRATTTAAGATDVCQRHRRQPAQPRLPGHAGRDDHHRQRRLPQDRARHPGFRNVQQFHQLPDDRRDDRYRKRPAPQRRLGRRGLDQQQGLDEHRTQRVVRHLAGQPGLYRRPDGSGQFNDDDGYGTNNYLTIGVNNGSGTWSGQISDQSNTIFVTKTGSGTETFSGTNVYHGTTTISGGVLELANPNAVENSTVVVNVNNGLALATSSTYNVGGLSGSGNISLTAAGSGGHPQRRRQQAEHDLLRRPVGAGQPHQGRHRHARPQRLRNVHRRHHDQRRHAATRRRS